MLTQALPYNLPSAATAAATYQPINTAHNRPSLSARPSTASDTGSSRKLSLHSIRSNTSWTSTSTWTSNASSKTTKSVRNFLRSLRRSKSSASRSESTLEGEHDELAEILSEKEKEKKRSETIPRNPEADKMFTWAALGAYASYPGAGPLVGWF